MGGGGLLIRKGPNAGRRRVPNAHNTAPPSPPFPTPPVAFAIRVKWFLHLTPRRETSLFALFLFSNPSPPLKVHERRRRSSVRPRGPVRGGGAARRDQDTGGDGRKEGAGDGETMRVKRARARERGRFFLPFYLFFWGGEGGGQNKVANFLF